MTQELPEGTVTIVFTDVVGSTDLATTLGDTLAQEVMRAQRELVRQQIESTGGFEVKGTGDGFMVAFQSSRRAVECAIGVQRAIKDHNQRQPTGQRALVRIGMNAGEVIREDADMFGSAVNAAARVAAKASGNEILVSETVKSLLGVAKDLQFADRGRFRLKGFPERWHLFEVIWQEEAPAKTMPALAERTPFVGRESEREELRGFAKAANSGQGTLVLIGGEAGVGKSRLVEEVAAEARELGMLALTGRCYEMTGSPPYIPFVEMLEAAGRLTSPEALRAALGESAPEVAKLVPELRRMLPDIQLPPELPPEQERRYAFNGVRDFLSRAGRAQPLLLIIEDLHWADESSVALLLHIAEQLSEMPLLILATYRDLEVSPSSPLSRALEELTRRRLARNLAVKRLPEAAVAAMLRALGGREPPKTLIDVIFAETEGNPFFVEEVLKHLAEERRLFDEEGQWREISVGETDVPDSLRLVIGRRLERLPENVRRVLTGAAVVGRSFSFELLTALSELDADALLDAVDDAERAQMLISMSDGPQVTFRFSHELIRQTLLSSVSAARRQRLHLRVAEEMEQAHTFARQEYAPDVAYHLAEAGASADPVKTAHYLALAGDRALSSAAYEDALRHYEDALSLQPGGERRTHADLLYKRGFALRSLGRWEEALADWREAVAGYQSVGDTDAMGRTYGAACQQLLWSSRWKEALDLILRGLAALGKRRSAERCILLAGGGLTLSLAGFYEPADKMINEALALAEEVGGHHVTGRVRAYKGFHHFAYAQFAPAVEETHRAMDLLRSAGDLWELCNAMWINQFANLALGRLDEAAHVAQELIPLATRLGQLGALSFGMGGRGYRELMLNGDIALFEELTKEDLEFCRSAGLAGTSHTYSCLGLVAFWRGDWETALRRFEEAVAVELPGAFFGADRPWVFLAKAYAGDRIGALAALRQKARILPAGGTWRQKISSAIGLVRAAKASGFNGRMLWRMISRPGWTTMRETLPRPHQANTIGASHMLSVLVEGYAVLGARDEAAKLYPDVINVIDATQSLIRFSCDRLTQTVAGISAASGGQWEKAETHFQSALRQAHEIPHRLEQPEVRRWYARMLVDRDAPGDRDKARQLIREAIVMYHDIGMPKHLEMAEALLDEVGQLPGPGVNPH